MIEEQPKRGWIVLIVAIIGATGTICAALVTLGTPFAERAADKFFATDVPSVAVVTVTQSYIPENIDNESPPAGIASPSSSSQETVPMPTPVINVPMTTNQTLSVNADSPVWINSSVYVKSGQTLSIQASGKVTTWLGNSEGDSYPDGNSWSCDQSLCILYGERYGALLGRIGENAPFVVGSKYQAQVGQSGYVYFMMNDMSTSYSDNSGNYTVNIEVR